MAHPAQREFFKTVKERFPERFRKCNVLDVGSLDINGNNRWLFDDPMIYTGIDIGPGPNVDFVSPVHEYQSEIAPYDVVISSECFEHDRYWEQSLPRCIELTKPGGLFTFTCAGVGRPEHGTRRSDGGYASPNTFDKWNDYYRNITIVDAAALVDVEQFSECSFAVNNRDKDLYFWGIKNGS